MLRPGALWELLRLQLDGRRTEIPDPCGSNEFQACLREHNLPLTAQPLRLRSASPALCSTSRQMSSPRAEDAEGEPAHRDP